MLKIRGNLRTPSLNTKFPDFIKKKVYSALFTSNFLTCIISFALTKLFFKDLDVWREPGNSSLFSCWSRV